MNILRYNLETYFEKLKETLTIQRNYFMTERIEKISNARDIVNLRNRIIHAYDNINDTVIWTIIINRLPLLKKEVNDLIK